MELVTIANLCVLIVTVIVLFLAIEKQDLLHSAILLGMGSASLGVVFFIANAPIAAVFELVVCAGLITVLFISVIALTGTGGDS